MVSKELSPKKVAAAIGVSESSLKRWCDRGLIRFGKTPGGHRRIETASVVEFLKNSKHRLVRPELLGMAQQGVSTEATLPDVVAELTEAMAEGQEERCRRILVDLFLADTPISVIGDEVIRPVFVEIGRRWDCNQLEVFHERRACEIATRLINELRKMISQPAAGPIAIGGTIEHDHYTLPCLLVEVVLRQHGWRAQSLGPNLPIASMSSAVQEHRPRLFWLSVSHIKSEDVFVSEFNLFRRSIGNETAVVVGGRALTESVRERISYSAYCDNLQHLENFAAMLYSLRDNPAHP